MRTDDQILSFVDTVGDQAPGAAEAAAVVMYRGIGWDVHAGSRTLVRNTILKVNDPAAVADIASSFYLDARGVVGEVQAFRIRDGELTRPDVQVSPGDGRVRRARIRMDLADLQAGDILGASSVTLFDNILYYDKVPIGGAAPVAQFNLRIRSEGDHTYTVVSQNYPDLKVEAVRYDDARPVEWHATATAIPAVPDFRGMGPHSPATPLALIAESQEYVPIISDWASTLAWPRVALFLSGIREKSVSTMVAAWELAPQITAGAKTNAEAEQKIFEFVRDELELMVGPAYDPLGARTAAEVLESGRATPMEQVAIMVTLLAASGLPGEICAVRPAEWGDLDMELQSFAQFSDVAVRCGKNNTRYYVPYIEDAPAGTLPPEWGRSWLIAPEPGLVAKVSQVTAEVMSDPSINAHSAFSRVRERATEEGWFMLEQVGQ
jgi:transglutaminase-like putative cysteine protease